MTKREALEEARKRWGSGAYAVHGGELYRVGAIDEGWWERATGMGWTWELAFADADRRTQREEA